MASKVMKAPLSMQALNQLFAEARTFQTWQNKPVTEAQIKEIYDLFKWGPTAFNSTPARVFFLKTDEAKERLAKVQIRITGDLPTYFFSPIFSLMLSLFLASLFLIYSPDLYGKQPKENSHFPCNSHSCS